MEKCPRTKCVPVSKFKLHIIFYGFNLFAQGPDHVLLKSLLYKLSPSEERLKRPWQARQFALFSTNKDPEFLENLRIWMRDNFLSNRKDETVLMDTAPFDTSDLLVSYWRNQADYHLDLLKVKSTFFLNSTQAQLIQGLNIVYCVVWCLQALDTKRVESHELTKRTGKLFQGMRQASRKIMSFTQKQAQMAKKLGDIPCHQIIRVQRVPPAAFLELPPDEETPSLPEAPQGRGRYASATDEEARAVMARAKAAAKEAVGGNKGRDFRADFQFEIEVTSYRVFSLRAPSLEKCLEWVQILSRFAEDNVKRIDRNINWEAHGIAAEATRLFPHSARLRSRQNSRSASHQRSPSFSSSPILASAPAGLTPMPAITISTVASSIAPVTTLSGITESQETDFTVQTAKPEDGVLRTSTSHVSRRSRKSSSESPKLGVAKASFSPAKNIYLGFEQGQRLTILKTSTGKWFVFSAVRLFPLSLSCHIQVAGASRGRA